MTKTASIVILSVICAIALFFGVCSCLPGGLEYGDYNVYNAAVNLIQGDSMFADSIVATYKVKINEDSDATINDIASSIRARLGNMYGRYFSNVSVIGDDKISVTVSKTANSEKTNETAILSAVTATGKVELVSSTTYSADAVILDSTHIARMRTQRYAYGDQSYHVVNMKLNKAGAAIGDDQLYSTSNYYLAVDGVVSYGVQYSSDGRLMVYTRSEEESVRVKGLTKSGALEAKLTLLETSEKSSCGGLVFGIIMAALIAGTWVFYAVRYKKLAVAGIVSQLLAVVAFIMFSGLVHFKLLNLASVLGTILGFGLMSTFTCLVFEKLMKYKEEKTLAAARHLAFRENNFWNCIVHLIVLVVGIALWLIPTGVTAPLGNVLVYSAVLSFCVTMGLNRLFTAFNLGISDKNSAEKVNG